VDGLGGRCRPGGEVTGSACHVQTQRSSVLVDAGLFQGGRKPEALTRPPTGPRQKLDAERKNRKRARAGSWPALACATPAAFCITSDTTCGRQRFKPASMPPRVGDVIEL